MTNSTKYLLAFAVVGAMAGILAFFNIRPVHDAVMQLAGTSPAGGSFNTAKFAGIAVAPSAPGSNATTSSMLNTDANDRYITGVRVGCEGVGTSQTAYTGAGLASFTLTIGTSSAANPATAGSVSTNTLTAVTIATSSAFFSLASSTTGVNGAAGTSKISNIWASGSYLSGQFNATNTAACTWGVDYVPA